MPNHAPLAGTLPRAVWIAFAVAALVVWFAGLDTRVLQGPDEGRYAEIAREMVATGDYLTPRLNGLKYFEKPPLQYWTTAASFRAFGIDEWTARLAPALGALLAIIVSGITVARLAGPLAGAYAITVLAGAVLAVGLGHFLTLDALLTGFLTLALGAFLCAQQPQNRPATTRNWMLLAYAALAAATLTKGPVALVIAGGALVGYTPSTRDTGPWRRLHLLPGLALYPGADGAVVVLVPSCANPEFARFFFIHEHVERFLSNEARRPGTLGTTSCRCCCWAFCRGPSCWLGERRAQLARQRADCATASTGCASASRGPRSCSCFLARCLCASSRPLRHFPMFPAPGQVRSAANHRFAAPVPRRRQPRHRRGRPRLPRAGAGRLRRAGRAAVRGTAQRPPAMYIAFRPWLIGAGVIFTVASAIALAAFRRPGMAARSVGLVAAAAPRQPDRLPHAVRGQRRVPRHPLGL